MHRCAYKIYYAKNICNSQFPINFGQIAFNFESKSNELIVNLNKDKQSLFETRDGSNANICKKNYVGWEVF